MCVGHSIGSTQKLSGAWTRKRPLEIPSIGWDDVYGIMSSHPFACLAAASSFGSKYYTNLLRTMWSLILGTGTIENVSRALARKNVEAIMRTSPIPYIREAVLCGTLFESQDSTGFVCGVDTKFFVDHTEPLEALSVVRGICEWPLGDLLHGREYLLLLPSKYSRSRSRSSGRPEKGTVSGR